MGALQRHLDPKVQQHRTEVESFSISQSYPLYIELWKDKTSKKCDFDLVSDKNATAKTRCRSESRLGLWENNEKSERQDTY